MTGIGIIGAGYFGEVHAQAITLLEGARVVAVASGRVDQAESLAARYGGKVHQGWRAVLEDDAVEAVVIATPHHMHTEITVTALGRGKHVLLEKPMAPTVAECDAILAAERAGGGRLMVGHLPRFLRPVMAAGEIVASGRVGRPVTGTSAMVKLWMQGNRRPWHLDPATGGGMLMTAGIHALDQLVWLMGSQVVGVSAMAGAVFHEQAADDTALINLRFSDGRIGQVTSIGYRDGASTSALSLQCEGGVIDVDLARGVRIGRGGTWENVGASAAPDGMVAAVAREWRGFLDAVETGGPVPVDGAYGRHIVAVIDAALRSGLERREIEVG